ncbi:MAG: DegV family protein [Lachnospiraceae bacterium]|nr:DegV family protein [Lachnospiraceae bacterium]
MNKVKIITDSCSDLSRDLRDKYDIDYAKMYTEYEGKETAASLDWDIYTPQELYKIMRDGKRVLTTQVPVQEFKRVFTKYINEGFDIVYIGCSSKQSGSVNTGFVVAKELMEQNPGHEIYVVDALNACMGEGILAIRGAEYRDLGKSAKEIFDLLNKEAKTVNEYITVHSLDALKRAGRVKASAAFLGNLFGVKPILISDKNGDQVPIKKVKGRQTSLNEVVSLLKESIVNPEEQTVYIVHADCEEEAKELEKIVKEQIPCKDTHISYIGPIIGASIGPDAIGLFAFGKEVTFVAGN